MKNLKSMLNISPSKKYQKISNYNSSITKINNSKKYLFKYEKN